MSKILIIFGAKYLIFLIILIALWYFLKQSKEKRKQLLVFGVICLPAIYVVAEVIGYFYFSARPFVVGNFTPLIAHDANNGFPSDHTLLSSAVSAVIFYFDRKLGILLFVLAFLVGISRVFAGVHHFSDVVGSILIVVVVASIIGKYIQKIKIFKK